MLVVKTGTIKWLNNCSEGIIKEKRDETSVPKFP